MGNFSKNRHSEILVYEILFPPQTRRQVSAYVSTNTVNKKIIKFDLVLRQSGLGLSLQRSLGLFCTDLLV